MNTGISLGLQLALSFILFISLGYWLDKKYNSLPIGLLIGVFLAFIYGIYEIWKIVKK